MAKTREQAKKRRKVVKRGRPKEAKVVLHGQYQGRLSKPIGCEHIRVAPEPEGNVMGYRVHGVGYAAFAWDAERMADTPRFVCSICEASTPLPGLLVRRGEHG